MHSFTSRHLTSHLFLTGTVAPSFLLFHSIASKLREWGARRIRRRRHGRTRRGHGRGALRGGGGRVARGLRAADAKPGAVREAAQVQTLRGPPQAGGE